MTLLAAILLLSLTATAIAWNAKPRPPWLPKVWWAIGMCETGLNYQHNTGTYQGAYGFYHGSWDAFRPSNYPSEAYNATPRQQLEVARAIWRRYGFTGWGCKPGSPGHNYWIRRAP
jgi:transglycosylase-like protein